MSPGRAVTFLTASTVLGYASAWLYGRAAGDGSGGRLLGEYHEDAFQLLLSASAVCLGLSCGFGVAFLPVPVLLAVSVALWIITRQLRWAFLTIFVLFTVGSILAAYRLSECPRDCASPPPARWSNYSSIFRADTRKTENVQRS